MSNKTKLAVKRLFCQHDEYQCFECEIMFHGDFRPAPTVSDLNDLRWIDLRLLKNKVRKELKRRHRMKRKKVTGVPYYYYE